MNDPHKLAAAFNLQAYYCRDLDSPFMGEACELFAENLTPKTYVGKTLFDWPGDITASGASLPLRLMGCLHRLVISGESPELAAIYPPNQLPSNAWSVFEKALVDHEKAILHQLQQAPQTNEVRRSAILLPGFLSIAQRAACSSMVMSELGASAGLNLYWDKFSYTYGNETRGDEQSPIHLSPEWRGPPLGAQDIHVGERAACDLNPIDLNDTKTIDTLLSYLWADQPERLARTRAAIDIFIQHDMKIEKTGAIDWLKKRLSQTHVNHVHVIYHTIARQYFSDEDKAESKALIEAAGARASENAPLAWLRFEADGQKPGASLTLRLWRGHADDGIIQFLARADYHGRWIDWAI